MGISNNIIDERDNETSIEICNVLKSMEYEFGTIWIRIQYLQGLFQYEANYHPGLYLSPEQLKLMEELKVNDVHLDNFRVILKHLVIILSLLSRSLQ
ncbi:hypothetical protein CDAR_293751 [Caerostris darwini]|uniref:Uncharacterized protein n=1 Tax=Caerostris darwini TaxID=1538125 RepID=A0AAV4VG70_9ARAC|nr:hypothetical protein CDAR_293751 [Caerostris darwini]